MLFRSKYILWTDEKTGGKNADITSSLIIFYFDNNEQSKGTARYNKAVQSANKDFVAEVNYNIGQYYLTKNNHPPCPPPNRTFPSRLPFQTASSNAPCPTAASCWPVKKTNCPPTMPKRKTPGSCTKSAAATRGFQRRLKKAASPKCSTSTL